MLKTRNYPLREFTFFVNLDILRDAVFLCNTPLEAALLIAGMATARALSDAVVSFSSTAVSTDFIRVFTLDFTDAFLRRFTTFCLLRFSADLCVAKNLSSFLCVSLCGRIFYMNSCILSSVK